MTDEALAQVFPAQAPITFSSYWGCADHGAGVNGAPLRFNLAIDDACNAAAKSTFCGIPIKWATEDKETNLSASLVAVVSIAVGTATWTFHLPQVARGGWEKSLPLKKLQLLLGGKAGAAHVELLCNAPSAYSKRL